jgi:hypothetical protein
MSGVLPEPFPQASSALTPEDHPGADMALPHTMQSETKRTPRADSYSGWNLRGALLWGARGWPQSGLGENGALKLYQRGREGNAVLSEAKGLSPIEKEDKRV